MTTMPSCTEPSRLRQLLPLYQPSLPVRSSSLRISKADLSQLKLLQHLVRLMSQMVSAHLWLRMSCPTLPHMLTRADARVCVARSRRMVSTRLQR